MRSQFSSAAEIPTTEGGLAANTALTNVGISSSAGIMLRCWPFIHSSFFVSNTAAFFDRPSAEKA